MSKIVDFGSPKSIEELDEKVEELEAGEFPVAFRAYGTKFHVKTKEELVSSYSAFRAMYKNLIKKNET